jgi:signal transduction histidine kinase
MTTLHREHMLRMEAVIARLRLGAVMLAGVEILRDATALSEHGTLVALWSAALIYAAGALLFEPYRHGSLVTWNVVSGLIDWALITVGIVLTGAAGSPLYLLYFLSVLSVAMRFGLREVLIATIGTAASYLALVAVTTGLWSGSLPQAAVHMGYLVLFAVGTGVSARELTRQFHARINDEAHRLAVQEMTTTVGHDLKNPLAAVSGLVDMLLDSAVQNLSFDQRALLHRIDANTRQMVNLVGNLLDAELIETGQQAFRPAPADLNAVVRRVVEAQAHQAEDKQIGLVLDLDASLPAIPLDDHMIERLVANLLSNAVKFTPTCGAVRVSTRLREAAASIEVWDSGPDVPPALRGMLFQKFVRQSDSPGIGLGLYICKSIVDTHRGTISLHKPSSGGVSFIVELPLTHPATARGKVLDGANRWSVRKPAWGPQRRAGALVNR